MYRTVRFQLIGAMLLAFIALMLAACQAPQAAAPTAAPQPTAVVAAPTAAPQPTTAAPAKLTKVQLSYSANTAFQSLMWVSKDKGLFEKYGLDADVTQIQSVQQLGAAQAGKVDFGMTSADNVASAILNGAELEEIALFVPYIEGQFWCRPEIKTAQDLKGKIAGTSTTGPGINRHTIEYALTKLGLDPSKDMELRVFKNTTAAFAAAQSGQIQCVALFPPEQLQAQHLNFNLLYDVSKDNVLYPSGSAYTTKKMIQEHPDLVLDFLKAISEGIAVYKTDQPFAIDTYQKWAKLDDRVAIKSGWDFFSTGIPDIPLWQPDYMQATLTTLSAAIPKAKTTDPTTLYDNSFIDQLVKEGFYTQLQKEYPH